MRLGISEKTVEKHVAKGMRLIAGHFYGGDARKRHPGQRRPNANMDMDHGQQHAD